jgi:hypothetical protein
MGYTTRTAIHIAFTPSPTLYPQRLCRNEEIGVSVILNEVKNLMISTESIIEILPCLPAGRGYRLRMTLRRSLARGRERAEGRS